MSEACCSTPLTQGKPAKDLCPGCGQKGKSVQRITLGSLLKPEARKRMSPGDTFFFCPSPDCKVVYFLEETMPFYVEDLKVPVTQKVKEGPKPVCYCFGYTEEAVIEDVLKNEGKTNIPAQIAALVKAGNCFCEVTNPQGACCLNNVNQAVKKGASMYGARR